MTEHIDPIITLERKPVGRYTLRQLDTGIFWRDQMEDETDTQGTYPNYSGDDREYASYATTPMEFSVGSVFSRTFSALMQNPVLFFGLAILAAIPGLLLEISADESSGGRNGMGILNTFFGIILQGAIAFGVYRLYKGEKAGVGEALGRGLARFLPLLGIAIIEGLGIGIGFILLIVPGLILYCMWFVSVPACVVEGLGVFDSLRRSAGLTKGYRWKVLGMLICLIIVATVLIFAVSFIFSLAGSPAIAVIGIAIVSIFPAAFQNVMISTIYYNLRAIKEGVSVDNLANVFD